MKVNRVLEENVNAMNTARVSVDPRRTIGEISPLLFGGFAEHLGRCIYEGIYDPGSPHADSRGLRTDVMAALREIGFTVMRYPGGNFVSGYNWLDGVGPKDKRPKRPELAWQTVESNQFGTDEFIEFCREIGTEPMLAVNLGTGSVDMAAALVEYCNAGTDTSYAELRRKNGHAEPYGVKYWCLGNEMDGPWQIGHLNAEDYGKKALEAAKLMKWTDPTVKLVVCGSSGPGMNTYPEWDRVVLEHCWEHVDYLSMHRYIGNQDDKSGDFLASNLVFEAHVDDLAATLRYVKAKKRSKKDVFLSWDEWNVWYKGTHDQGAWTEAPHLLEEGYNLEDALVVANWLNVFLRKCDVLKVACLAQIVNVIGALLTTKDLVLRQSIFYPLAAFAQNARGSSLDLLVDTDTYPTESLGDQPALDVTASLDPKTGRQAFFFVNRSQTEPLTVEIEWASGAPASFTNAVQMAGTDLKAANTFVNPNVVRTVPVAAPTLSDGKASIVLPPASFTMATSG
jgi:alpha-N-arabinofuranosidase